MDALTLNSSLDFQLLNDYQRDFPLVPAPFAELAARLGVAEKVVLGRLENLRREGKISRVGAVFAPKRIGASTLAAMAVPADKLEAVAVAVNRFPEVNHNYEREHRYNLWFVVTAATEGRLQASLGAIEQAAGYPLLALPLQEEFHIDLGFCLRGEKQKCVATAQPVLPAALIDEAERRLVSVLQEGLPLFIRPFALIAERIGVSEPEVLGRIRRWLEEGAIKRFGVVVRHHELGYRANAMLVHNIADDRVSAIGRALAEEPSVTLCYRRPRHLPEWPYNLFCMIHGRERGEVESIIADLRQRHGLESAAHEVLFSLTRFKQNGARYA
ncbi:Lrp/AsnC family transcriptional regulator [Dechloromonas sp. HYN0024]|uniref:siroheme decarboxylase subunit beta n=1 Tax=Dechloromonas sp. HYN0024 TaxID=2231055 RepID=UPI000E441436|nr:Lrp/AsnC family transcriptional regulator [Dechloromonas sp. HYN0024]AXS80615.1 Lrp/AsnC family transcriptional regulator [Dechloromonas sp. HYN0024]